MSDFDDQKPEPAVQPTLVQPALAQPSLAESNPNGSHSSHTRRALLKLIVEVESALAVVRQTLVAATKDQASEREVLLVSACESEVPPNQRQLARRAAISPAQTSELVEKLRKRGWLERLPDPNDRRRQCWQVTATGKKLLVEIDQQLHALGVDRVETLTKADTEKQLLADLGVLRSTLAACMEQERHSSIKSAA